MLYYRHRKEGTVQWETDEPIRNLRDEGTVQWETDEQFRNLWNEGTVQWKGKWTPWI